MLTSKLTKTLGLLLVISATADLINYILAKMHVPTIIVANSYFILQFLLLSYIFSLLLSNRKLIYNATALYSALYLFFFVMGFEHFNDFQSRLRAIEDVVLLIYCVLYYRQLLKTLPAENIWHYAPFWITTAALYYFGLNLLLFIITNYVFTNLPTDAAMTVWGFHNFNNIVKNILFAVGIYYAGKKQEGL
ncbi:MAG TPA: hypothetical protein VFN30_14480 [Chitinophagaceae bacterium]|nr:hypothetical protein [Chitinophagaceae bacterium]